MKPISVVNIENFEKQFLDTTIYSRVFGVIMLKLDVSAGFFNGENLFLNYLDKSF